MIIGNQSNFYLRNENFQKNKEDKLKNAVPSDLKECSFAPNGKAGGGGGGNAQIGLRLY